MKKPVGESCLCVLQRKSHRPQSAYFHESEREREKEKETKNKKISAKKEEEIST